MHESLSLRGKTAKNMDFYEFRDVVHSAAKKCKRATANSSSVMTNILPIYILDALPVDVQGGSPPLRGKTISTFFVIFCDKNIR